MILNFRMLYDCSTNYWKKKGVLTNASTGQTNTQYYMHGLSEYTDEMVDYITSICTFPIITASRTRKEKKAVHNELLMHQTYPANPLYNLMNSMLFRQEGKITVRVPFKRANSSLLG